MARALGVPGLVMVAAALALAGCSPASLMERLPSEVGGLPSGTPAAASTPYRYPAVHDTPPPRAAAPLTDEQQLELEKQLQNARQRQEDETTELKSAPADTAGAAK